MILWLSCSSDQYKSRFFVDGRKLPISNGLAIFDLSRTTNELGRFMFDFTYTASALVAKILARPLCQICRNFSE